VTLRGQTFVAASLLGAALLAWIVTVDRMHGMDAGPGTDLGALGWYVGIWATMMAAMMLPSAAPMVLVHARVGRGSTVVFVAGYLVAWTVYGLAAYAVYRGIRAAAPSFLAWDRGGPWVVGGALIAAGVYQLTPLKTVCLRHCRSPVGFPAAPPRRRRAASRAHARRLVRRLLRRADARALRARRDEPRLDGGRRTRDPGREGAPGRRAARVGDRGRARRARCPVGAAPASVPGLTEPQPMRMMGG